jgi:hypothetical protein
MNEALHLKEEVKHSAMKSLVASLGGSQDIYNIVKDESINRSSSYTSELDI